MTRTYVSVTFDNHSVTRSEFFTISAHTFHLLYLSFSFLFEVNPSFSDLNVLPKDTREAAHENEPHRVVPSCHVYI